MEHTGEATFLPFYSNTLMRGLQRLQTENCLSDVTIKVDGRVFHAHRCILAAVSPYFEAMFSHGFQESCEREIEIKAIDGHIFEMLLNCVYSGRIELSHSNTIYAFKAAVYLQLSFAKDACVRFLLRSMKEEKMSDEDAVAVLKMAEHHKESDLILPCYQYLSSSDHFLQAMSTDLFLEEASYDVISRFLRRIDISPETNEEQLFQCVVSWLKHDWNKRKVHAAEFLKGIRLGLIPQDKLVTELMDAQILELPECQQIMEDSKHDWKDVGGKDVSQLPESFLPRNYTRTPVYIGNGYYPTVMTYFNKDIHQWIAMDQLPEIPCKFPPESPNPDPDYLRLGLRYHASVAVNGDIYVAGGDVDGHSAEDNRFLKFDGASYTWQTLPCMSTERSHFTLIHLDGFIYAIGGSHVHSESYKTAERFNVADQVWDQTYPLPKGMKGVEATSALIYNGKILVYGLEKYGKTAYSYVLLAFDPVTQKWSMLLKEKCLASEDAPESVIVAQDDICFRVWFDDSHFLQSKAHIHAINFVTQKNGTITRASMGNPVGNQDAIQRQAGTAFQINGQVYVTMSRCVHKIGSIQDTKKLENLTAYEDCDTSAYPGSCAVEFTLDLSRVTKTES